jgi:hypothetical protein
MATEGLICWNCGRATGIEGRVARAEPVETNIVNKEKSNFCDYFQMRDVVKRPGGIRSSDDSKDDRKSGFDDLFKD